MYRALPLLALVMLLRCLLDPADNVYYHTPFLMALVAAGAFSRTLIPALVATVLTYLSSKLGDNNAELLVTMYLGWSIPMAAWLAARAYGAAWTLPRTRLEPLSGAS